VGLKVVAVTILNDAIQWANKVVAVAVKEELSFIGSADSNMADKEN
jgi:hypothetical protein